MRKIGSKIPIKPKGGLTIRRNAKVEEAKEVVQELPEKEDQVTAKTETIEETPTNETK